LKERWTRKQYNKRATNIRLMCRKAGWGWPWSFNSTDSVRCSTNKRVVRIKWALKTWRKRLGAENP
jgi:hypothetical protein